MKYILVKTANVLLKKMPVYVSFPYYGYVSERLRTELGKVISGRFPQCNFRFVFRNNFKIGSFFNHKDKLPSPICSNIIYSFKCLLCNKQYIGSTTRQLQCRISEHLGVSVRTGLPTANTPNSAIFEHREVTGHRINSDQFSILKSCSNKWDVRLLEALYIKKEWPELNDSLPVELSLLHWGLDPLCGGAASAGGPSGPPSLLEYDILWVGVRIHVFSLFIFVCLCEWRS